MAEVRLEGVTKRYGGVTAVDHVDLRVADGELLVLLGPSGCGKTTVLRLVAGLEDVTEGTVSIGDRVVNDVDARARDVAMVFQSYALYPHLTVAGNIAFPLRQRQRKLPAAERDRKVRDAADSLGLGDLLDRRPGALSGGQRQRVALARAIVRNPQVFLLDEPLSNLDAALRAQTRADIVALQRRLATTMMYVTHDQVEAMTMGDRIAVVAAGVLQQVAKPQDLYEAPENTFVAGFLGSPPMALIPAVVEGGAGDTPRMRVPGGSIPLVAGSLPPEAVAGRAVVAGLRPEDLALAGSGGFPMVVTIVELLGADTQVVGRLADGTALVVRQPAHLARPHAGEAVRVVADAMAVHLFDAETGRRLGKAAAGQAAGAAPLGPDAPSP